MENMDSVVDNLGESGIATLLRSADEKRKGTQEKTHNKDSGYLSNPTDVLDQSEQEREDTTCDSAKTSTNKDESPTRQISRIPLPLNNSTAKDKIKGNGGKIRRWRVGARSKTTDQSCIPEFVPASTIFQLQEEQSEPENHSQIETLDASNMQISAIPDWISKCKNLKNLYFKGNIIQMDDNFFKFFTNNDGPSIKRLNLEDQHKKSNSLKGTTEDLKAGVIRNIPDGIAFLHLLEELQLRHNGIEIISPSIGCLRKLVVLDLSMNKLRAIPSEMCTLLCLEYLTLQDNCLTELPSKIGDLANLKVLGLSRNNLKIIPDSLCNLVKLETLSLENNDLYYLPLCLFKLVLLDSTDENEQKQDQWWYARSIKKGLFVGGNPNMYFPLKCTDMETNDIFAALKIKHKHGEDALKQIEEIKCNIQKACDKPSLEKVTQDYKQLTDVNLLDLVSHIDAQKILDLGIYLKLTYARITQIQSSFNYDSKSVLFHILNEWRGQWTVENEDSAIKCLREALSKMGYRSLCDRFTVPGVK